MQFIEHGINKIIEFYISDMEKYSRGRRGAPAKGVVRETAARVQIPPSPPILKKWLNLAIFYFYYTFGGTIFFVAFKHNFISESSYCFNCLYLSLFVLK